MSEKPELENEQTTGSEHTHEQAEAEQAEESEKEQAGVKAAPKPAAAKAKPTVIVPREIAKWNKHHAHVLAGGKSAVLQEWENADGYIEFKLLASAHFKEWNGEHEIEIGKDKNGNPVMKPAAEYWLQHSMRRKYQDIGFFPGREPPKGYYNLWRGFAVEPIKGDCSKFLAHIHDNVCQGDDELYDWVIAWFADIFQKPGSKHGTSLALRGAQGTGKSKVGEVMRALIGVHYKLVSESRYVTGRFNAHMISLLLLHADEAFFAGDHRAVGKLRDLVTGNEHPIEFKGKDAFWVKNYVRLFVTGDQDWIVPAAFEERRFATLDMGEAHKQDHEYFKAIDEEMDIGAEFTGGNKGGRQALLYHLLYEVDCSKVNLRAIPHTDALLEQKVKTSNPEQGWWLDILSSGTLPGGDTPGEIPTEMLFNDYIEHAKKQGAAHRSIQTALGIFLNKYAQGMRKVEKTYRVLERQSGVFGMSVMSKEGYVYVFPPLQECRTQFLAKLEEPHITWDVEGDWHTPDWCQQEEKEDPVKPAEPKPTPKKKAKGHNGHAADREDTAEGGNSQKQAAGKQAGENGKRQPGRSA